MIRCAVRAVLETRMGPRGVGLDRAPCSLGEAREPRPGANPANKTSAGKRIWRMILGKKTGYGYYYMGGLCEEPGVV